MLALLAALAFLGRTWSRSSATDEGADLQTRLVSEALVEEERLAPRVAEPVLLATPPPTSGGGSLFGDGALERAEVLSFDRFLAREKLAEGLAAYFGDAGVVDDARARASFEAAAEYEGRAAFMLAVLYERGRGVAADERVALDWLRRSADLGYAPGQYALGVTYLEGRPGLLGADAERAYRLLAGAASQGHEAARAALGRVPES